MKTVTITVCSIKETKRRVLSAFEGEAQDAVISFETPQQLFKVLSGKRWDLIMTLTGAGPISIREASRRVGRDVKDVHTDVHRLINSGILRKTDDSKVEFPYEAIHIDFIIKVA